MGKRFKKDHCQKCEVDFDVIEHASEKSEMKLPEPVACPNCGTTVRMSETSGWWNTYRNAKSLGIFKD